MRVLREQLDAQVAEQLRASAVELRGLGTEVGLVVGVGLERELARGGGVAGDPLRPLPRGPGAAPRDAPSAPPTISSSLEGTVRSTQRGRRTRLLLE